MPLLLHDFSYSCKYSSTHSKLYLILYNSLDLSIKVYISIIGFSTLVAYLLLRTLISLALILLFLSDINTYVSVYFQLNLFQSFTLFGVVCHAPAIKRLAIIFVGSKFPGTTSFYASHTPFPVYPSTYTLAHILCKEFS